MSGEVSTTNDTPGPKLWFLGYFCPSDMRLPEYKFTPKCSTKTEKEKDV